MFLAAFIIVEICEIFTVGGFPLDDKIRKVSSSTSDVISIHPLSNMFSLGIHCCPPWCDYGYDMDSSLECTRWIPIPR